MSQLGIYYVANVVLCAHCARLSVNKQLLSLQTEQGPSPAAPEHIEDLPTVSIQQETVGE